VSDARQPYVLTYDVVDDGRRTRLAKYLEARGHRVQYSVFELLATSEELDAILAGAQEARRFDPEADSLRCYPLCGRCMGRAQVFGAAPAVLTPDRPLVL
jgi:CRISPR-associated protein Cas2